MALITLTTDFGTSDFYVSAIKGAILSQLPDIQIIDISHDVPKFDIATAAFMLRNTTPNFPANSIHIIGVLPNLDEDTVHLAVKFEDQYYIGADNGIFSLLFDRRPQEMVELQLNQNTDLLTFPTREVFVQAACHLGRGGTLSVLGPPKENWKERTQFRAVVDNDTIRGTVIYVDSYGNVISNISRQLFRQVGKGRDFTISFRVPGYDIHHISNRYDDVVASERLALFGASGFLEIAINIGHANKLLGLKINDIIRIEFHGN
ncbi:MAG: S-adenosyl-l-methionine hydroxide adenosyltransferase family protein [Salibacteraceae bacterium]